MSTVAWTRILGDGGLDRAGAVASSVCAVHCLVCALLPAVFGALGVGIWSGVEAEWAFTLVAVAIGLAGLRIGWRQHRSRRVALLMGVAIVGLLASRGVEAVRVHAGGHGHDDHHDHHHHEAGTPPMAELAGMSLEILPGVMLLIGHLLNIRASRRCCSLERDRGQVQPAS